METYAISNQEMIYPESIIHLDVCTRDANDEGYLLTDGTNRGLACGIMQTGELRLWITTNGGDLPLYEVNDNPEDALAWAETLGDVEDDPQERRDAGVSRLRDAITQLRKIYEHNDDASETLDWMDEQADAIEALIAQEEQDQG